ncbi:hypothetical protein BDV93DRAFT_507421 [Ceratobasidium sp. AG-I]|nr:hypothetical protein BDV93DRAFT_507421 [Ceratobasidium sp. AG-I]
MQFHSTLSRFAAFVLFMLSFSMLACAAPAPVAAPGALVARRADVSSNSLVARTDVSDQCHKALLDLDVAVDADIKLLNTCYDTKGCDCKPIIIKIVADIQIAIDIILKLVGTIDVKLDIIVKLVVSIIVKIATACGKWVIKLGLVLYLQIFVQIDGILCALINALIKLSVSFALKIKLAIVLNLSVLVTAHLTALIKLLGL